MKKILLSAFALMAAMSMNAQEVCVFNADNALGLDADNGTALTAGTVIGETESIVATVGADDTYKPQSATFTVNGQEITGGLQGSANPKDADGGTPSTTLVQPAGGAYLQFEAKADGFLYVMHKASSNKAYTVFEEGVAISYTFAAIGDAATDLGAVYQFTLPYEVENEQFVVKESIGWAEQEFLKITAPDKYAARMTQDAEGKDVWEAIKVNGLGVIKFPVYAGCKYIVNANGSKITAAGFAFSTEDNVLVQSGEVVIYQGEGAPEPVTFDVWTIAGGSNLMGSNWDTADTTNDMKTTDGVAYKLVKEGVVLEKGVTYEFKAAKDHAWTEAYPGENATLTVEETATYTVTFTFNAETKEVAATAEKTGEAVVGEKTYSVIGTINGNWDNDTDMEKGENGIYTAIFENVAAGKYELKVRVNHDWGENYGTDGNNYILEVEKDAAQVMIAFDPETKAITNEIAYGGEPGEDILGVDEAIGAYEYAGGWNGNWWNLSEDMNADVSAYDYLWIEYDGFEGEIQFGIFYSEWQKTESWGEVWYTDQIILTESAGVFGFPIEKTKVIEKGVNGVDSEYKGDIYAKHARQVFTQDRGKASKINIKGIYFGSEAQYNAAKEASAIQGVKVAQNDGAIYNLAGQKVNAAYKGVVIQNGKKFVKK